MKVTSDNVLPPVGPSWLLTASSKSHATALGSTVSVPSGWCTLAQTVLLSRACHVTRIVPLATTVASILGSDGLGLKKWVMICLSSLSLNRVACGVKSTYLTPVPEALQM